MEMKSHFYLDQRKITTKELEGGFKDMIIPLNLINEVRSGRVVLCLGSGASKGALNKKGEQPPDGNQLAKLISHRFLGGKYETESLSWISDIAISESDLRTVQDYIKTFFDEFTPGKFHYLLPTFQWRGISTTNYDLLIETCYNSNENRVQKLVSIISNKDRYDDKIRSKDHLAYLKLHGCISRTGDEDVPLILTPDQYVTHREGRNRLFSMFEEWGYENPTVFVGQSLIDSDLRQLILELSKQGINRPRYYLIKPNVTPEEQRFWESKRITIIEGTFKDFLIELDDKIPKSSRILLTQQNNDHPLQIKFRTNEHFPKTCYDFFINDADYVHAGLQIEQINPATFYKGFDLGWNPIEKKLDVRRNLTDILLHEVILASEDDRLNNTEFILIKAEAGAGKSILLRRLAWEAAIEANAICIYFKKYGQLNYDILAEIHRLTQERIFVFVDNARDKVSDLEYFVQKARKEKLPITIFTAERINEWNMSCDRLERFVTNTYKLNYLSRAEIEKLLMLLDEHNCLGYLKSHNQEERLKAFEKKAGRQLLVALHEATLGKPYEEILVDEYNEIRPRQAQLLYLSVCFLNRLNVLVRSGLISRVHGIAFDDFKSKFFAPLEHVVQVVDKDNTKDYHYAARHTQIAEIVFTQILKTQDDRFNEYISMITALNLSFDSDREAYKELIKGRSLLELFPDHQIVVQIFKVAETIAHDDSYLYHQKGIYEIHRPNGNLHEAEKNLLKAKSLDERDLSILHSLAELFRVKAENVELKYEKERFRNEAKKIAHVLYKDAYSRKYAIHTLIKILMDELSDLLNVEDPSEREIDSHVKEIEGYLEIGLQEYPGDSYLLSTESRFHRILEDEKKAFDALYKAFQVNKRDPFISIRLSKYYQNNDDVSTAIEVMKEALDANPGEKKLHFNMAKLLMNTKETDIDTLIYHLKRSFTKWDHNLDAQFWFAHYCYISGEVDKMNEARDIFRHFRDVPMSHDYRVEIRSKITNNGTLQEFKGIIAKKEETFGSINRDGIGDSIFLHKNNIDKNDWNEIQVGDRLNFGIGFNFGGPIVISIIR